jgi:G3E family GTPase|tara:strand:- start:124 stop:1047 length:924 start_codon:yes stop_codon:yes gene_type:complete
MSLDIPVTVIGGYLGAGKTTLVNHLLRNADGRKIAILVNEFGDLPIDADLIEAQDDELIAISGGCICCSFGSDMTAALIKLSEHKPAPDYVVIEASGVAMPGSVAANISFLDGFRLSGIVVLADSERILVQAADEYLGDTMLRQISDADLIVQTKVDLVNKGAEIDVQKWIGATNPRAQILSARNGKLPPEVILGVEVVQGKPAASLHADSGYESKTFTNISRFEPVRLAQILATGEFGVLRAKGFVEDLSGDVHLVQIVGERYDVTRSTQSEELALVCIGRLGCLKMDDISSILSSSTTAKLDLVH